MIQVFIGTKAQYIKMVPLLRLMDASGVEYRLIDSGQHAQLAESYRREFGLRDPDYRMGGTRDVESIPQALWWALGLSRLLFSRSRLRDEVFGGHGGVCVVHGDTPTTLLSTLMAKRAGLSVAHVESGLRTQRIFHPFPEELMRIVVPRLADVLFAPGPEAAANLRKARLRAKIVEQEHNTVLETMTDVIESMTGDALESMPGDIESMTGDVESMTGDERDSMTGDVEADVVAEEGQTEGRDESREVTEPGPAPALITLHRVENLHRRSRRQALVETVEALAAEMPVRWVLHGPTERALRGESQRRLQAAGVELVPLMPRGDFINMLAAAPFIITDGGSIQEECAALGVPTLLWCGRTGRPDGLGENIVLSGYDNEIVAEFLRDPQRYRRPPSLPQISPSEQILGELYAWR